jgi:hypothetical protein
LATAFSCVAPSGVPDMIAAGAAQLMSGVAFRTVSGTVAAELL